MVTEGYDPRMAELREIRERAMKELEAQRCCANAPDRDLFTAVVDLRRQTSDLLKIAGLPLYERSARVYEGTDMVCAVDKLRDDLREILEDQKRVGEELLKLRAAISSGLSS